MLLPVDGKLKKNQNALTGVPFLYQIEKGVPLHCIPDIHIARYHLS